MLRIEGEASEFVALLEASNVADSKMALAETKLALAELSKEHLNVLDSLGDANEKLYSLREAHSLDRAEYKRKIQELENELRSIKNPSWTPPRGVDAADELRNLLSGLPGNRIAAIKAIRTLTGLGLKESKDLLEESHPPYKQLG